MDYAKSHLKKIQDNTTDKRDILWYASQKCGITVTVCFAIGTTYTVANKVNVRHNRNVVHNNIKNVYDEMFLSYLHVHVHVSIVILFFSVEEFKKYYKMPGWGKPLYEMKEAEIPKVDIPPAFDWRDKGKSITVYFALNLLYLFWQLMAV